MKNVYLCAAGMSLLLATVGRGEIRILVERNGTDEARAAFKFKNVPSPSRNDAGSKAKFTIIDGRRDENGGDLAKLHDGKLPKEEDQPAENFFFDAGTKGGRILLDLGTGIEVKQINSYSWHASSRAPQVYSLYGGDTDSAASGELKNGADPEKSGWKLIGKVDTRPKEGPVGGQYGVSISDSDGTIGKYRYLLFDMSQTEARDPFGNTFYSEIDVMDRNAPDTLEPAIAGSGADEAPTNSIVHRFTTLDGKYQIAIDSSRTPDLTEWADQHLVPVALEWYPKLVAMLPSEGYAARTNVTIAFKPMRAGIPAATGGGGISCNMDWFRKNLKGEAVGAVVHELVHVVQAYGYGRRNPNATRTPGWLVEGIPDYIRWFLYEPQTKGAEITRRNIERARYDASYRVTGNFLNWVTHSYDTNIVLKLNAAARQGKYSEDLWKASTGKTVQELGDEWKKGNELRLAALGRANSLADDEKTAGWKLLFNGENFDGWHNFKSDSIRAGWQVKDGALVCADPHNAGDLCTKEQFDWFELQLDYNISEGGNSGIMFHVTDDGHAAWATGPEFQLEDNAKAADPQRCGWLYALYQPPDDPKTGKPLDATKPAGQWNHVRLLISPEKCEHEINGVKYFEYVLGSDDFKQRVAKSKFGRMPLFAKFDKGYIALQGDHGEVSFRNIKIRPVQQGK